MQQLVVFSLGDEEYCLPITQVQEIIRYTEPRSVPHAQAAVRGVINLRGKIIPVCDLRQRLGLAGHDASDGKIVIVDSSAGTAGLVVDDVDEVLSVSPEQLSEPPAGGHPHLRAVARVDDRLLILLDSDSLLMGEIAA